MKKLKSMDEFKSYWDELQLRIADHADEVKTVILHILPMVVSKMDSLSEICVRERMGNTGNVVWVFMNSKRYCFSFDHKNRKITLREGRVQGRIIHSFDNNDPFSKIETIFNSL